MNASCSPYGSTSYVIVAAVSAGLAAISLLMLLGVIFILILFKKWKFFSQRLIFYLATSAMLVNIATILHRVDYDNRRTDFNIRFCELSGFLDQVSKVMLLMSVCSITISVSLRVFCDRNTEKLESFYVFLIFVFPLTFSWIPFIWKSYGRVGAWCWIRSEEQGTCELYFKGLVLQYTLWFGPLYILMFILIVIYLILLIHLYWIRNKMARDRAGTVQGKMMSHLDFKPLIVYPLFYFLLNIFPFINQTYHFVQTDSPILALWYLEALAMPSIGTLITIAYFLDPETRKRLNLKHIRGATMDLFRKEDLIASYQITGDEVYRTDSFQFIGQTPYRMSNDYNQDNFSIQS